MESILTQVTKGTKSSADGVHTRFLDETEVTSLTPSLTPQTVAPQLDLALAQMRLHELGVPRMRSWRWVMGRVCGAKWKCLVKKHDKTWINGFVDHPPRRAGYSHRYAIDKEAAIEYMLQEPNIIGFTYNLKKKTAYFGKSSFRGMDDKNTFHEKNPTPPGTSKSTKWEWHVTYLKKK